MIEESKKYKYANGEQAIMLCYDRPHSPGQEIVSMRHNGVIIYHDKLTGIPCSKNYEYYLVEEYEPEIGEYVWIGNTVYEVTNKESFPLDNGAITLNLFNKSKKETICVQVNTVEKFIGELPYHLVDRSPMRKKAVC